MYTCIFVHTHIHILRRGVKMREGEGGRERASGSAREQNREPERERERETGRERERERERERKAYTHKRTHTPATTFKHTHTHTHEAHHPRHCRRRQHIFPASSCACHLVDISNVSSTVIVHNELSGEMTFENFYRLPLPRSLVLHFAILHV